MSGHGTAMCMVCMQGALQAERLSDPELQALCKHALCDRDKLLGLISERTSNLKRIAAQCSGEHGSRGSGAPAGRHVQRHTGQVRQRRRRRFPREAKKTLDKSPGMAALLLLQAQEILSRLAAWRLLQFACTRVSHAVFHSW